MISMPGRSDHTDTTDRAHHGLGHGDHAGGSVAYTLVMLAILLAPIAYGLSVSIDRAHDKNALRSVTVAGPDEAVTVIEQQFALDQHRTGE